MTTSIPISVLAEETSSCPLCCEEIPASNVCRLSQCSHESCQECLVKWIEKAEACGRQAACPFCRMEIAGDETLVLLGRAFEPANTTTAATLAREVQDSLDDLTRQWLDAQTKPCPSCGAYIEKMEGGCDRMECLCGFRFCFGCGSPGASCSCTPAFHRFWDNVLDQQASVEAPPAAVLDDTTGCIDLRKHISKRKQDAQAKQVRRERFERREEEACERLEEANCSAPWLFCRTNESSLRVLVLILRGQSVRWVRGRKRMDEEREQREVQFPAGKWLYSTKDCGFKVLRNLYSFKAIKVRSRRRNVRANNTKELTGVDAAFSSGKWLYYCNNNNATLRQVTQFSNAQKNETAVYFDRWFLSEDFWCGCGDSDCEDCQDAEEEAKENAARIRVLFLDEEAKAKEMAEINKNGL